MCITPYISSLSREIYRVLSSDAAAISICSRGFFELVNMVIVDFGVYLTGRFDVTRAVFELQTSLDYVCGILRANHPIVCTLILRVCLKCFGVFGVVLPIIVPDVDE